MSRGYAVGFREMSDFVLSQLPQNEVIENALRRQVKLLPDDAIRELIANALIHQDFMIGGMWPVIEIYSNRIEVSNPGEPVIQVERFIDGYQSRNERLSDFMRRMSLCEERSSGVDRIIAAVELYQLPAPDFRKAHRRTVAVIYGPRPFEEMDREDRIRACYQHCVLKYVLAERMTNQSLRERFGLEESRQATISQIISATLAVGLIKLDERVGESRRYARYAPFWA
jgi:ATP-dependent DNA helicase RecG